MLAVLVSLVAVAWATPTDITISSHWSGGFNGEFCIPITAELHGWKAHLVFDQPLSSLEIWKADVSETLDGGKEYVLVNKAWDGEQHTGDQLCINFLGHGSGDITPKATVFIEGLPDQPATKPHVHVTYPPGVSTPVPGIVLDVTPPPGQPITTDTMKIYNNWTGRFEGELLFPVQENVEGWMINLTSEFPIIRFDQNYIADVKYTSPDQTNYLLVNKVDKDFYKPGDVASFRFVASYQGDHIPHITATFTNLGIDKTTLKDVPQNKDGTKYNYAEVLYKSILFYEAQRSGKLPPNNRVLWRGDSGMDDKGLDGEDLTGGWYDAGDHVKFGFPMAATTTVLTLGLLQWKDAYKSSGQLEHMYDCIKWPLDYFLKAHVAKDELYVQVGSGGPDHGYWGRPEDMTMARPAYKITPQKPGSDAAGETAAAFAAGYLAFKEKDPAYAAKLLTHAKDLYEFATTHKGKYSESVGAAQGFYTSNNYTDELAWAGLWMFKATGNQNYLDDAEKLWDWDPAWGMSWDDKVAPTQAMLYNLTGDEKYKTAVEKTFKMWMPGGTIDYTPKGLAWRLQWASLRYASNMAMVALLAADYGINTDVYRKWAMSQINYALGDTGQSYVVGFGKNPPLSPHHRAASCSWPPSPCGHAFYNTKLPNIHVLNGALVGGPGRGDDYKDDRQNYVMNEVACDYNAGFQSAVAALKSLAGRGLLPAAS